MLLCLASLLTTLKENFGAPIDCIVDKDVPESVFEVQLLEWQFVLLLETFLHPEAVMCGISGLLLGSRYLHSALPGIVVITRQKLSALPEILK